MSAYYRRLKSDVLSQFHSFDMGSEQSQLSIRAAAATCVAIFIAILFQTQEPFWAGISAFMVTQSTIGSTLNKSIARVLGTVLGALLGLSCLAAFINQPPLFCLVVFLVAFFGIYISSQLSDYVYAWLLGYITALIVMIAGLADPVPDRFVEIAFFRSFEIIIGVLVSGLLSLLVYPKRAAQQLRLSLRRSLRETEKINGLYFQLLINPADVDVPAFESRVTGVLSELEHQEALLLQSEAETLRSFKHHQSVCLLVNTRNILEAYISSYRYDFSERDLVALLQETMDVKISAGLMEMAGEISAYLHIAAEREDLHDDSVLLVCREKVNTLWARQYKQLNRLLLSGDKQVKSTEALLRLIQSINNIIQQVNAIDRFSLELADRPVDNASWLERLKKDLSSFLVYDPYLFRFAMIGASAILFVPFSWLYFNLPGYCQIAILIAACLGMTANASRYKGYLRFMGCLCGGLFALVVLFASIQSLSALLLLVFIAVFVFSLLHFGAASGYFGTQAAIVFIIAVANGLAPSITINAPVERLLGVFLGVLTLIVFQYLFWPFKKEDELKHCFSQLTKSADELFARLFDFADDNHLPGLWDSRGRSVLAVYRTNMRAFASVAQEDKKGDNASILGEIQVASYASFRRCYHGLYRHLALLETEAGLKQFAALAKHEQTLLAETLGALIEPIAMRLANVTDDRSLAELSRLQLSWRQRLFSLRQRTQAENEQKNNSGLYLSMINLCYCKALILSQGREFYAQLAEELHISELKHP